MRESLVRYVYSGIGEGRCESSLSFNSIKMKISNHVISLCRNPDLSDNPGSYNPWHDGNIPECDHTSRFQLSLQPWFHYNVLQSYRISPGHL